MKPAFIILLLLPAFGASSQVTRYRFKVRFEDYNPLKNAVIIVNNQRLGTDDNGVVDVDIPAQLDRAYVESPNTASFTIKYPPNAQVSLPKKASEEIIIFIARPSLRSANITREDLKKMQESILDYEKSSDAKLVRTIEASSRRMYDSILNLLRGKHRDEEKIREGRLAFYPLVSEAMNHFLNEARDLKDAFAAMGTSLTRKEAYDQFGRAVYSYNEIYELLNTNKNTYEQAIATYWNSRELGFRFSNLMDYTLEEIHKPYVLEMNDSFRDRMYAFASETNRARKKELQLALEKDMAEHASVLGRRLNSLGERIASFLAVLQNAEITASPNQP